jgi:hypothetical protein
MRRYSFSNETIDSMIASSGDSRWTRDIPFAEITGTLNARDERGLMVVPAEESIGGRGAPVFDLYHPEMAGRALFAPYLLSLKVSDENRNPRNIVLTTGKGDRHIVGVLKSAQDGASIPVLAFNFIREENQWYRCFIQADTVLRNHVPVEADGKHGNVLTLSNAPRKSGHIEGCKCRAGEGPCKTIVYRSLRLNVSPCVSLGYTRGWEKVDSPVLPDRIL